MGLSVTTTETTVVQLRPALKVKLLKKLKVYAALRTQLKAIEAQMETEKAAIGVLREEAGVSTLALEGFKVTQVSNLRTSLNKMKLIELGVTTEMLEEATETKPGKPYEKITCPGDKSYDDKERA